MELDTSIDGYCNATSGDAKKSTHKRVLPKKRKVGLGSRTTRGGIFRRNITIYNPHC